MTECITKDPETWLDLVNQSEVLVLLVWYDVDVHAVNVLIKHVLRHHLTQPGGQGGVCIQLGVYLLCGEHGPPVGQGHNITSIQHLGIPPRQHLQPQLLHKKFPEELKLLLQDIQGADQQNKKCKTHRVMEKQLIDFILFSLHFSFRDSVFKLLLATPS